MKILPLYCFLVIATSSKIVFVPTPAAINLLRKKYERPGIRCYLWGTYTRHIRSLNLPGGDILAEFARIAFAEVKTYPGGKIKVIETHALIPELVLPYYRRALADIDLCCNSEYRLYEKYLSLFEQTCKEDRIEQLLKQFPEIDLTENTKETKEETKETQETKKLKEELRKKIREIGDLTEDDLIRHLMETFQIPNDWRLIISNDLFEAGSKKHANAKDLKESVTLPSFMEKLLERRKKYADRYVTFTDEESEFLLRSLAAEANSLKGFSEIVIPDQAEMDENEDDFSEYMFALQSALRLQETENKKNAENDANVMTEENLKNPLTEESVKTQPPGGGEAVRNEVIPGFTEEEIQEDAEIGSVPVFGRDYLLKIMSEEEPFPEHQPAKTPIITGHPANRFPKELFVAGHYPDLVLRCLIPASKDGSCFYAPGCYLRILERKPPKKPPKNGLTNLQAAFQLLPDCDLNADI